MAETIGTLEELRSVDAVDPGDDVTSVVARAIENFCDGFEAARPADPQVWGVKRAWFRSIPHSSTDYFLDGNHGRSGISGGSS